MSQLLFCFCPTCLSVLVMLKNKMAKKMTKPDNQFQYPFNRLESNEKQEGDPRPNTETM